LDLRENVSRDVSLDNEELIKFWKSSTSGSATRNFLRISHHWEIGHFSTVWLISVGKTDRIVMKIFVVNVSLDSEVFTKSSGSASAESLHSPSAVVSMCIPVLT